MYLETSIKVNKAERLEAFNQLEKYVNSNLQDFLSEKKAFLYQEKNKKINNQEQKLNISFQKCYSLDPINNLNGKNAVLIFGSQKSPGGGVTRGSVAQEEDISLYTTWYFQVKDLHQYYSLKEKYDAINSDEVIFTKSLLIKDINTKEFLNNPKDIYLIGAAAPNYRGLVDSIGLEKAKKRLPQVEEKMLLRIEKVLSCAQENKIDNLILGAWGCGVFGLDDEMVAKKFKIAIEKKLFLGNIIFAIPDEKIETFKRVFQENRTQLKI